ncbi:hypothetical protein RJ639_007338 [Escallonia herrerae]|uniref:TF-B3 domain-containing protein n=1 Tax=Escallonia herrerae TaxID=1293975 RepID=A0AA89AT92_9ASTE|nr:hypothetical protein RJ639_007338 [Escallonia herrerae]
MQSISSSGVALRCMICYKFSEMANGGRPRFFKVFLPFRHAKRPNNESLFFNQGWSTSVKDHFAELRDFFVFKYDGNSHFTVKVFDKSGCEKETAFLAKCSQGALIISQEKGKKRVREQAEPCLFGTTECAQQRRNGAVPEGQYEMLMHISRKNEEAQQLRVGVKAEVKPCEAKITNMCAKVIVKKNIAWFEITVADCCFTKMLPNSAGILPSSMFSAAPTELNPVMLPMDGGIFPEMLFATIHSCCNLKSFPMDSGMLPEIVLSFIARTYKLLSLPISCGMLPDILFHPSHNVSSLDDKFAIEPGITPPN